MISTLRDLLRSDDLDAILEFARRTRIIDGHRYIEDDGIVITLEEDSIHLARPRALVYLHGLLRAYAVGSGSLHSAEDAPPPPEPPTRSTP